MSGKSLLDRQVLSKVLRLLVSTIVKITKRGNSNSNNNNNKDNNNHEIEATQSQMFSNCLNDDNGSN